MALYVFIDNIAWYNARNSPEYKLKRTSLNIIHTLAPYCKIPHPLFHPGKPQQNSRHIQLLFYVKDHNYQDKA